MEPSLAVDRAPDAEARAMLQRCCGSSRWIAEMLRRRPFGTRDALRAAARETWFALSPADWREAFSHHPRIGDREALRRRFAATRDLPAREQAGVASASEATLTRLAAGNAAYEERFGYIFIVCAASLTADEMLAMLEARSSNPPDLELRIAAEEHARITDLRLLGI